MHFFVPFLNCLENQIDISRFLEIWSASICLDVKHSPSGTLSQFVEFLATMTYLFCRCYYHHPSPHLYHSHSCSSVSNHLDFTLRITIKTDNCYFVNTILIFYSAISLRSPCTFASHFNMHQYYMNSHTLDMTMDRDVN